MTGSAEISMESLTRLVLDNFWPGIKLNKGSYVGGSRCTNAINGSNNCEEKTKTKGAYPDIPIILENGNIHVEIDEHEHKHYPMSCELARYDTVHNGTETNDQGQLYPSVFLRFNPHKVSGKEEIPLEVRLRVLIQCVRNEIDSFQKLIDIPSHPDDPPPVVHVQYLFYDDDNVHIHCLTEKNNILFGYLGFSQLCEHETLSNHES